MRLVGFITRLYHDARSPECQKRTKIINAFEHKRSRIKRFVNPERSDGRGGGGALRKLFQQETNDERSSVISFFLTNL